MNPIHYRSVRVDGLTISYREAGPPQAPTLLLLHGFPTSSHMFRDLIPLLADRYHLVAPDYPGFGYSSTPAPREFKYTFDHLAEVMEHFTEAAGLREYALYLQDFGGPVGLRLAEHHPERVRALIIQNANAYLEGLSQGVRDIVLRAYTDHSPEVAAKLRTFFELPVTKHQYLDGAPDPSLVSPDAWEHAQWGMDRPGNKEIQFALHANYGSNVERYQEWHDYFRKHQPPTLVVWGKGDQVFLAAGAEAYRKDLKDIEIHLLDAGHFALETNAGEIAAYMRTFLGKQSMSSAGTEQNREIIRKAFEAWQHGTAAVTDVFADNMVWRIEGRSAESKEYPDKKAFIEQVLAPFAARFKGSVTPFRPARIRSIFADGATVIVVWDGHGIAKDGIAYDNSYTWIMAMKDGLVVDGTAFYDSIAFNEFWDRVKP